MIFGWLWQQKMADIIRGKDNQQGDICDEDN
jgi:hypothetical protein